MEWWMNPDRAAFAETAKKYAAFIEDWAKTKLQPPLEEQVLRVTPAEFHWELISEAGRAGLLAAVLSEDLGGVGLDGLARLTVLEQTAKGGAGAAVLLAVNWAALSALASAPEKEETMNWLNQAGESADQERPLIAGLVLPAVVVDNGALFEYIAPLHPGVCDRVVVADLTKAEPALISVPGSPLVKDCADMHPGSGLIEVPMARIKVTGIEAAEQSVLARGDDARVLAEAVKRELYLGLSAAMAGNAASALAAAWSYAKERVQTGRLIIEHQEVRRMLEQMTGLVEAARAMVYSAGAENSGPTALDRARRAFMFASEVGEKVCLDAIQVLGGYGYMKDYGIERRLRDHKTMQCVLGGHAAEWIGENW